MIVFPSAMRIRFPARVEVSVILPRLKRSVPACMLSRNARAPTWAAKEGDIEMSERMAVHDPRGFAPKVTGKQLAPRLEGFDGKTIYLVDCLFDNSEVFMRELQDWFGKHLPTAPHERVRVRLRELDREHKDTVVIYSYVDPKAA